MLHALAEHDVTPDLLVGTSSGALNASFIAGHGFGPEQVTELGGIWRALHTLQVFHPDPLRGASALIGDSSSFFSDRGTAELIARYIDFIDLQDAVIPLTVIATELLTGREVAISSGPALKAILASCAIPGLLPLVQWHSRTLVDGGLADDASISQAVKAGADRIYVLPCGYPCALDEPPRNALGILLHAMAVMVHERLIRDIELYTDRVDLIVIPPPCPMAINPLDFSHGDELIRRSYAAAIDHLAVSGGRRRRPAEHVAMHEHRSE